MEALMAATATCTVAVLLLGLHLRHRGKQDGDWLGRLHLAKNATLSNTYVAIALTSVLGSAFFLPPLGTPDEQDHLRRAAYAVSGPQTSMEHRGFAVGSVLPSWIVQLDACVARASTPRLAASRQLLKEFKNVVNDGTSVFQAFTNTAVYPPFFYLPQAFAILIGKCVHARPFVIFYTARALNGLCGVALGAWALRVACQARVFLFACLLLPMTLHQMGSLSPDATLIPASMLFVAYFETFVFVGHTAAARYGSWLALFVLLASSKLPLVSFALLIAVTLRATRVTGLSRNKQKGLAAAALFCICGWTAYLGSRHIVLRADLLNDMRLHRSILLTDPAKFLRLLVHTVATSASAYLTTMVGALGRNEFLLPKDAIVAGEVAMAGGLLHAGAQAWRPPWVARLASFGAVVGAAVLMLAIFFLTWTASTDVRIEGVQGRYFLYMVAPLSLVCCGILRSRTLRWVGAATSVLATAFGLGYLPWALCSQLYIR